MIWQYQGLDHIMAAIDSYSDDATLMSRCIKTLDFIAVEEEYATRIADDHDGVERIRKVMKLHPKNKTIQESGRSALLFLGASVNEGIPMLEDDGGDITLNADDMVDDDEAAEMGAAPEFPDDI